MVQAWKRYARSPDRVLSIPARRILIPEITFTVEDQYPDVIASRILVPGPGKQSR
jgi:hypothetical protein